MLGFIVGPKIQARRHFLTNQIRIFTYLFWSLNIFQLISFWAWFSEMFLFLFLGLIILRLENVYSIYSTAPADCYIEYQGNYHIRNLKKSFVHFMNSNWLDNV